MDEFPNVWPEGGVFAAAPVKGDSTAPPPIMLRGAESGIGWVFPFEPEFVLAFETGGPRLRATRYTTDICLPDCWRVLVQLDAESGSITGGFLEPAAFVIHAHFPGVSAPDLKGNLSAEPHGDDVTVYSGGTWWVAVAADSAGNKRRFGVAVSFENAEDACERARRSHEADVEAVLARAAEWAAALRPPDWIIANNRKVYLRAAALLQAWMDQPAGPGERALELRALGLQYLDVDSAYRIYLRALDEYSPEAREHHGGALPLLAWTFCRLEGWSEDRERLAEVYPRLVAHVRWYEQNRRNANGLFNWLKARSDNPLSPRGDGLHFPLRPGLASAAVDLSCAVACEYLALEKIARALGQEADANDWRARYTVLSELINELLWDDMDSFYYDLDECGEFIVLKRAESALALTARIADRDRAESLRMHLTNLKEFWSPSPISSVSQDETPLSADQWPEPALPYVNMLIYYGLEAYSFHEEALDLARATLAEVARSYMKHGCLFKRYDSMAALPPARLSLPARPDFAGTAAVCLHLMHEIV